MGAWVHGCMGYSAWVHGCNGTWVHGYMGAWVHVPAAHVPAALVPAVILDHGHTCWCLPHWRLHPDSAAGDDFTVTLRGDELVMADYLITGKATLESTGPCVDKDGGHVVHEHVWRGACVQRACIPSESPLPVRVCLHSPVPRRVPTSMLGVAAARGRASQRHSTFSGLR